jgi:hypothetical protein
MTSLQDDLKNGGSSLGRHRDVIEDDPVLRCSVTLRCSRRHGLRQGRPSATNVAARDHLVRQPAAARAVDIRFTEGSPSARVTSCEPIEPRSKPGVRSGVRLRSESRNCGVNSG